MLLDARHGRHLSATKEGLVWLLWGCLIASRTSHAVDIECCATGTTWMHSANCSNGEPVRLECSQGSYVVDPDLYENDNFTVVQQGEEAWLELQDLYYQRIPADRFCVTNRSESQIALVCFEEGLYDYPSMWRDTLFCVLNIVSAIFLILTLLVYAFLPELREIQDKAMVAAVTSLAVSYIVLAIMQLSTQINLTICVALGFLLYFGFVSAFFWLNIVAFNVWRSVWFKKFLINDKRLFLVYCSFGWGGPTCFLITAMITRYTDGNHLKPGFGELTCWFDGTRQLWSYFYGPIAILLTLNVVYLGLTGWRLWHQYCDYGGSKLRALRFKCLLYVKLILVMGVTWIFEVLSFADGHRSDFWIPTDILNGLQGLMIFLLLVATRKRVRKLLARKRPCGIGFPKSWLACEDEECEAELPEQMELSQQG